ncbi:MAG: DUF222 domain-containing protein [Streptosporangiales bacterium]|nr:DUF222 domain-containing protein [Streptosporangiales bacterium]
MCSPQCGSAMEGLELLRRGAALLAAHDPADAPVAAATEQLRELRGLIDDLEVESCRRLARFDACRGFEAEEARSAKAWLVHACGMVAGEAARRVTTARQLHRLPNAVEEQAQGEVSFGQLQVIADAVHHAIRAADPDEWTPDELAERAEPILLDVARAGVDCTGLAKAGRRLHAVLDPDGAERKLRRQFRDRQLSVATTFEGMVDVRGHGDPATGVSVQAAIEAFTKPPTSTEDWSAA